MSLSDDKIAQAHRMLLLSSSLEFTCKMFAYMNKTPYIIGEHHRLICNALDDVVRGRVRKLIINIAPRYGKTLLVSQMFIAYGLALNPQSLFLHLSYSGTLTQDNSVAVKDIVNCEYYRYLFDARPKYGSDTKSRWDTEQGGGVYATATLGQITGFGAGKTDKIDDEEEIDRFTAFFNPDRFAGAVVIDDPIKPEDALSDTVRESVNRRFETTIRNRVNSRRTPIIIIMQRLHEHDLCGYLQEIEPEDWTVLSLPCIKEDGSALWEFKHTLDELHKIERANSFVFQTQYMQNPQPLEGLMYHEFKLYDVIPVYPKSKILKCNYTDSADTGADFLCSIFYYETPDANYVYDVIYTKKPMEYTEQIMASTLAQHSTQVCFIESNNGGRGFRRNVERLTREYGNTVTAFVDFTQDKNKQVRIFTNSNTVNNITVFPSDWERQWPEFANAIKTYRKEGRNAHDDAPDALTGTIEKRGEASRYCNISSDEEILADLL